MCSLRLVLVRLAPTRRRLRVWGIVRLLVRWLIRIQRTDGKDIEWAVSLNSKRWYLKYRDVRLLHCGRSLSGIAI